MMALVSRPVGVCPACGEGKYGGVLIRKDSVLYGCSRCSFQQTYQLPALTKEIVYVDQLVLSLATMYQTTGRGDKKWLDLYDRLQHLSRRQLIVCPLSELHEHEADLSASSGSSIVTSGQLLSQGVRMGGYLEVEASQLGRSLARFLKGDPPDPAWGELGWRDAFRTSPHAWTDYTSLWVRSEPAPEDVVRRRSGKDKAHAVMQEVLKDWMVRQRIHFDEVYREELDCIGPAVWLHASAYYKRLASAADNSERRRLYWEAGHSVLLTEHLVALVRKQHPDGNALEVVAKFYHSDHFKQTPFAILQARLYAGMASHVKGGRVLSASDSYDVLVISRYAPYCDAVFVDDFMRSLSSGTPVNLEKFCGTQFFSAKTLGSFLGRLAGLESRMSTSHQEALELAYPRLNGAGKKE
ncbi:MAG: hypothetical protein RDU89_09070 [bacterium]|nr:hypothetical protein [bacterium]